MEKITAVVVTYNRLNLLKLAIKKLKLQTRKLDNIIVVNNGSTDGTKEWLEEQDDLDIVHQENVGGSGGFYRGIQYAYGKGFDWIWCMDDDVYPEETCLEKLLAYKDDNKIGIVCPVRYQEGKPFLSEIKSFNLSNPFQNLHKNKVKLTDLNQKTISIEGIAFEGPLIRRDVVGKIGLPNKDLFILYDDSDYSYRCVLGGYKVLLVTNAILNKEVFFNNCSKEYTVKMNKWKLVYHIRNSSYFNVEYGKNIFVRRLRPIMMLLKYYSYIFKNLFYNEKYQIDDIRIFFKAYLSGQYGQLGKIK